MYFPSESDSSQRRFRFVVPTNGNIEGSLLLRFVSPMNVSLVIMEGSLLLRFVALMKGSLVIMEGSLLLRFCYSNGW